MLWWVELSRVLLMGRATTGGVFWGVCEFSMNLGSLSPDGWVCILSYWLFGLRCPSLEPAGSSVDPDLGAEMGTSGRDHTD